MRGPSADAQAALVDELTPTGGLRSAFSRLASRVTGHEAPLSESAIDGDRMAEDFFGVSAVLRREASLRRTLTDGSLPAEAKAGLARSVFAEALDPSSMHVVSSAVGHKWTAPRDLADALDHVGVVALVKAAEGRGEADALEGELFTLERIVADNPPLRDALSDPARSVRDKQGLVADLLGDKMTPAAVRLAQQAVAGSHRTVALALDAYQRIAADHRDRLVATVRVARDLSQSDVRRLADALERQYGRTVHLNVLIDPGVIGGLRVEIGDDVIDGTVASRLDDARRRLAG